MRLQVGRGLHHVGRADQPAHAPAGHRVRLGHAVEDHDLVAQLGNGGGDAGELGVAVDQVLVDLVGDHPQAVLRRPAADRDRLLARVDGARRVGRRDEQQHLRPLGAGRLQLLDARQVAGGLVGHDVDLDAPGQLDRLGVGRPVGGHDEDLVARVEQRRERLVDGLLAAVGDEHLRGLGRVAGVAQRLGRDRLLQLGQPAGGRVLVEPRVARRLDRRLDDVAGRREVGLAGAEADDGPSFGLHRLRLGVHGERGGLGNRGNSRGDAGSGGHASMFPRGPHAGVTWAIRFWFDVPGNPPYAFAWSFRRMSASGSVQAVSRSG